VHQCNSQWLLQWSLNTRPDFGSVYTCGSLLNSLGWYKWRRFRRVGVEVNGLKESQNIHKTKSHSVLSLLCGFLVNQRRKREWEDGREKMFRTQSKPTPFSSPGQYLSYSHLFLLAIGGNLSRHCPLRTAQYLQFKRAVQM